MRRSTKAFSMLELMVCIGIIAVLMAVLVPVLARVREQSRQVVCANHLRQLVQACFSRAGEARGYAGLIQARIAPGSETAPISRTVSDTNREKYLYLVHAFDPAAERLVPLNAVVAKQMGIPLQLGSTLDLVNSMRQEHPHAKVFRCPSVEGVALSGTQFIRLAGQTTEVEIYPFPSAYAFNLGVFGYDHDSQMSQRYLRGQISNLRSAAATVIAAEQLNANVLPLDIEPGAIEFSMSSDGPHRGKRNVAFGDGRVETK